MLEVHWTRERLKDMKLNVLGTVPNLMLGLVSQLSLLLCERFPSMK